MKKRLFGVPAVALVLLTVFFGSAGAAALVTSEDIRNFTIRKQDLHRGSVDARAIEAGAVGRSELSDGLGAAIAWSRVPSGRTIRGAAGGDFESSATVVDWGVDVSLPVKAANALSDDDVFVNVAGWASGDIGQIQPTSTDTNAECDGTPAAPTAPPGTVCIYVAGGDNATDVSGYSVLPGTAASPYGFKLAWTSPLAGDTFIDAVWAYTAP
jgi:hypothetical protein